VRTVFLPLAFSSESGSTITENADRLAALRYDDFPTPAEPATDLIFGPFT
jgi:hypothetical protein